MNFIKLALKSLIFWKYAWVRWEENGIEYSDVIERAELSKKEEAR